MLTFLPFKNYGQELISTSSGKASSATTELEWSIGEVFTSTASGTISSTSGFNQPSITIVDYVANVKNVTLNVYPNITSDVVNVKASETLKRILLYDVNGKLLKVEKTSTISLNEFKSGTYLLRLEFDNNFNIYTIIKQ
jgi:hypothetical protein